MSEDRSANFGWTQRLKPGEQLTAPSIVLRVRPYRDSDLIAHIFTPNLGKISVIARHARGSKKRFPSALDVFDRGSARLTVEKNGAFGVAEFTTSHSLIKLRQDLDKLMLASLVCECFDLVLQEHDVGMSGELFEVLDLSLNAIDEAVDVRTGLRSAFIALSILCQRSGIVDLSTAQPSSRSLTLLLDSVERFCERPLATRNGIQSVIKKASPSA